MSKRYFQQFLIDKTDSFVESVFQHAQYVMTMALIVSYLLTHYVSILTSFGATIGEFFTLFTYQMSNNYFKSFFHIPNCFLKGIGRGINVSFNLIGSATATASDTSGDANFNDSNEILCNSSKLSFVAARRMAVRVAPYFFNGNFFRAIFFFFTVILGCILHYIYDLGHKLDTMGCIFDVLELKHLSSIAIMSVKCALLIFSEILFIVLIIMILLSTLSLISLRSSGTVPHVAVQMKLIQFY